jgi:hypothetical protein
MCNDPGTPAAFQEGGEVFGTIAGRPVSVGTPGEYQPGITDLAYGLMQQEFASPSSRWLALRLTSCVRLSSRVLALVLSSRSYSRPRA